MAEAAPIDAKTEIDAYTQILSEKLRRAATDLYHWKVDTSYDLLESLIVPTVSALLTLVIFYFLGKYFSRILSAPISRRVDETLGKFVEKLTFRMTVGFGILFVLSQFGIRSTSFAAVLAAAGFAIGLALQGTLSNFASGILLMVFRPFKVGDVVVAAGIHGRVHEIDLFNTVIDTADNRRIIVPNSSVSGNTIENVTYHQHRRIEVPVGIEYRADMDQTREALFLAVKSIDEFTYEDETKKPEVRLNGFGASTVDWAVQVWANTSDVGSVRDRLVYAIKTQLDAASIGIAFPQLDIHLDRGATDMLRLSTSSDRMRPRLTRSTAASSSASSSVASN
jgi:small conductance mechanosensitive channel